MPRMSTSNPCPEPTLAEHLAGWQDDPDWDLVLGEGPVIAAAIHDGHEMRSSLERHLAIDEDGRRRDEDPMTGLLTSVGDVRLRVKTSRFQVDLNRARERALSTDPADTWGVRFWKGPLPQEEIDQSLAAHARFYKMMHALIDAVVERHGCALLLDIHSYNHRREGARAAAADPEDNPDIDLGVTTLDRTRWGSVVKRFGEALRATHVGGREPDVRENVRYPDGGHFPECLYARYGSPLCAITLEYKKIYMDEWTAQTDIDVIEAFRAGLERAVDAVRGEFAQWR